MDTKKDNVTAFSKTPDGNVTTSSKTPDGNMSNEVSGTVLTSVVAEKIIKSLDQNLKPVAADAIDAELPPVVKKRVPQIDKFGFAYATGKRKNAIARVWIKPGQGNMMLNKNRQLKEYFQRETTLQSIHKPLVLTKSSNFDVRTTVKGGGLVGQAEALMYGIAKALIAYDPNLRPVLKQAGLLTRDARIVERKKYGRAKARKRFQFSKR